MTRGLRNNNPGNIRLSKTTYLGETTGKDASFKAFKSMAWGYRAIFVLLYTYQVKRNLNTVEQMINVYAPAGDGGNDPAVYIKVVASAAKVKKDEPIDTFNPEVMIPIVAAISKVENGTAANMADVKEGWELFRQHRP